VTQRYGVFFLNTRPKALIMGSGPYFLGWLAAAV